MKKLLLMAIVLISINTMADNNKKNVETTVKPSNIETNVEKALNVKNDSTLTYLNSKKSFKIDQDLIDARLETTKLVDIYVNKVTKELNEKTRK